MNDVLQLLIDNDLCVLKFAHRRLLKKHARHLNGWVLDAGCGHMPYALLVPCARYVGMEISLKAKPAVVGSVMQLPFAAESFDNALCQEVLEHVPHPASAAKELFRVVKPGGHVFFTVPQMWYNHYEPHDYQRFTNHGLRHVLEQAGFEVVAMERTGGFWRFLFVRMIETTYRILRVLLFPLAVHNRFRNAAARFLCSPLNLLGLLLVPVLDLFSRRDHLGWATLARKPVRLPAGMRGDSKGGTVDAAGGKGIHASSAGH